MIIANDDICVERTAWVVKHNGKLISWEEEKDIPEQFYDKACPVSKTFIIPRSDEIEGYRPIPAREYELLSLLSKYPTFDVPKKILRKWYNKGWLVSTKRDKQGRRFLTSIGNAVICFVPLRGKTAKEQLQFARVNIKRRISQLQRYNFRRENCNTIAELHQVLKDLPS